jgi:hypothetical protein
METIAGFSVDEVKKWGLSSEDVEYVLEKSSEHKRNLANAPVSGRPWDLKSVCSLANLAFEQGIVVGIAKVRGLASVGKKIGF